MPLQFVSVILDLTDGEGNLVTSGSATFTPSAILTDVPDGVIITQAPIQVPFSFGGSPSVKLLATDNASPSPSGWAWNASFSVNGSIAPYSFFAPAGPVSFTATNASPAVFTWTPTAAFTAAGLSTLPNGTGVQLSGGSLPTGFVAATTYYVVASSGSTFQLAATPGGSAIASTSTGSGNVTVTQYNLSSLTPVGSVGASSPFMLVPSGTASAGRVPVATGSGEASAWTTLTAASVGADAAGAAVSTAAALDPVNVTQAGLTYNSTAVNAIGDGASHPLSGVFATQAAAQTFFASAVTATGLTPALTDELNWWVIQTYLVDGKRVYAPQGTYLLHRALIIPNGLAVGLTVKGAGKGVTVFQTRNAAIAGGINDCSVFIDKWLLSQATNIAQGSGYNYNNPAPVLSERLSLSDFTVDGNRANASSGFYAGYNYGIGINAMSDINVSNIECRNVNGWGFHDSGTSLAYTERGTHDSIIAVNCGFWGIYVGYRNRKKTMSKCIAMGCGNWSGQGFTGTVGSVKGAVQQTAVGGFFLDCSEMQVNGLQAHGNNGDGIFIRNVLASQYQGLRATFNGGAGIHVLGLVSSHGVDWLAVCNGTNPGNGQSNVSSPAPDSGGVSGGGSGTYTGAPDIWFDDSSMNYGVTNFAAVTGVECGTNSSVSTTWGNPGAEIYGLWLDDGIGSEDLAIRALHNTSSYRAPASPGAALIVGDVSLDTTAADIQPLGTQAAGSSGLAASANHVHPAPSWVPADSGLLAANFDPALNVANQTLTAGSLYLLKLQIRQPLTISRLWAAVTVAGVGASSGSFAGLYSPAGTLLTGSADIGGSLTAAGALSFTLTTPQALAAGTFVWAAFLVNLATTQPAFAKSAAANQAFNAGLIAAAYRAAVNGTGLTSLPASITPSGNTGGSAVMLWAGAS